MVSVSFPLGVENCPERVDAADAEAPMPPRVETGMKVESMETALDTYPERMHAMILIMRFFWRTRKNKQEAAGAC